MNHSETKKSNSLILKSFRLYVNKFIIIIILKASVYSISRSASQRITLSDVQRIEFLVIRRLRLQVFIPFVVSPPTVAVK